MRRCCSSAAWKKVILTSCCEYRLPTCGETASRTPSPLVHHSFRGTLTVSSRRNKVSASLCRTTRQYSLVTPERRHGRQDSTVTWWHSGEYNISVSSSRRKTGVETTSSYRRRRSSGVNAAASSLGHVSGARLVSSKPRNDGGCRCRRQMPYRHPQHG